MRKRRSGRANIPYQVPTQAELPERLDSVLRVIYLVFNEGYAASSGAFLTRHDLSAEAIRLGPAARRLVARAGGGRIARADAAPGVAARGAIVAVRRVDPARSAGSLAVGPRADRRRDQAGRAGAVLAAVSAHTRFRRRLPRCTPRRPIAAATDWDEIVGLYDVLARTDASPVIELNRAVAVAMRDGPEAGLAIVDAILERGDLIEIPARPRRESRSLPSAGSNVGRARVVRARAGPGAPGAGAPLSRAPARRAAEVI